MKNNALDAWNNADATMSAQIAADCVLVAEIVGDTPLVDKIGHGEAVRAVERWPQSCGTLGGSTARISRSSRRAAPDRPLCQRRTSGSRRFRYAHPRGSVAAGVRRNAVDQNRSPPWQRKPGYRNCGRYRGMQHDCIGGPRPDHGQRRSCRRTTRHDPYASRYSFADSGGRRQPWQESVPVFASAPPPRGKWRLQPYATSIPLSPARSTPPRTASRLCLVVPPRIFNAQP